MFPERPDQLIPAASEVPQTVGTRYLAAEIMEKRGFNPITKLIDLLEDMEGQDELEGMGRHFDKRIKVISTLAKYYAPQPKSIDVNVKQDNTLTIQTVDYTQMIAERQGLIPVPVNRQAALLGVQEAIEAELSDD